jgi:paraquat-inducible protein B
MAHEPAREEDENDNGRRTAAAVRHSRWPGWIWAVPLAAGAILLWLGLRFFVTHGASATVIFDSAANVEPRNTQVVYRGVKVGEVSDVSLTDDGQHVKVELSLDRSVEKYLRSGTQFWLKGSGSTFKGLDSLKSLLSGPTVMMKPGTGKPQHHFIGLRESPVYDETVPGRHFTLLARKRGSVEKGSDVYYLGLKVGKVTDLKFTPPQDFRFDVLIRQPYDQLVHANTRFWDASAVQLSTSGGLGLQLLSPSALFAGAIAFETPGDAAQLPPSDAGAHFTLYDDRSSADLSPAGEHALYTVDFPGDVGSLKPGAPVKLRGFSVGTVQDVELHFDPDSGELQTPVTLELDASRLHLNTPAADRGGATATGAGAGTGASAGGSSASGTGAWTDALNKAVAQLVAHGMRARLQQQPALVGSYYVALDVVPDAPAAKLDLHTTPPHIPAAAGGGLGALTTKLGNLPIDQIAGNVRRITRHINRIVTSPQVADSLQHIDGSLQQIDAMLHEVAPQVPPLVASLRRTAAQLQGTAAAARQTVAGGGEGANVQEAVDELTRAARSVRALADYLERHPEALIKGKQR